MNAPAPAAAANPLEGLAAGIERADQVERTDQVEAARSPDEQRAIAEGEQKLAVLMANVEAFSHKLLQAVRGRVAVKLPEIREHWSDDNLRAFANAVPPVLAKRLGAVMPLLGAFPEECMLLVAAAPLAMGYMSAISDHADAGQRQLPAPADKPAAPAAAAPGPAAHNYPTAQVVG